MSEPLTVRESDGGGTVACVICGKGPVDSEVDSSEDDDDTLCSKLEPYKCAAHPFALYFVFC